ncbi:Protein trichome birefringence-like 38 [Hibiscus syriacus]|uniref:Protein trichome birefringence-like 38 n=1 Tax=Hibiscus syriacus TaxID=106335 RepID=A0A6A2Y005_HIBSY|nr:Protein trichome birefringence-like 38 [Hibiscus syriacus]
MESVFPRFCWIILSWILILCIHQVQLSEPQPAGGCDYFRGTWVFDQTYPLYNTSDCPFIEKEFDCQANGRPDQLYLRYRWKPSDCMLPSGEEWNGTKSLTCRGQIRPATDSTYEGSSQSATTIVNEVLKNMLTPVVLLDITRLSQLRKDGHPSIYSGLMGNDCSHWRLAGVPDTWNEILYAILTNRGT